MPQRLQDKFNQNNDDISPLEIWEQISKNNEFETEQEILLRIEKAKEIINLLKKKPNSQILFIGHANFFFYFTSKIIENEYFGQWLDNGEIYTIKNK